MSGSEQTFEQALEQLEAIVREIEEGKVGLEQSIQRYEQGMKLLAGCRERLAQAELKVQQLQEGLDGQLQVRPQHTSTENGA